VPGPELATGTHLPVSFIGVSARGFSETEENFIGQGSGVHRCHIQSERRCLATVYGNATQAHDRQGGRQGCHPQVDGRKQRRQQTVYSRRKG
jgi:hypothetical protein